jgi:hypothetical protein
MRQDTVMRPLSRIGAVVVAVAVAAISSPAMSDTEPCATFAGYAEGDRLPGRFEIEGFAFRETGLPGTLLIAEVDGQLGLRFSFWGLDVDLPAPTNRVRVRVAATQSEVSVFGMAIDGTVVARKTIPDTFVFEEAVLEGAGIVSVRLIEGRDGGTLLSVCLDPLPA